MKNSYKVLGLMSGTSLDGLDMACCEFVKEAQGWSFNLERAISVNYNSDFQARLKGAVDLTAIDLLALNNEFGRYSGQQARAFLEEQSLVVDFIASHGHTVFHQIDKALTYQIGAGQELANHSGHKVICDFRSLDVSLGGQGAPLVPIGDHLLFSEYEFCLNLGGISNASFQSQGERRAFDISPVNMLLSHILSPTGLPYDDRGEIARSGKRNEALMNKLNALEFYQRPFPKSLGYEWFCEEVVPVVEGGSVSMEDKLCTAVHHIAFQIAESLRPFAGAGARMLVTGGGAKNHFLTELLQEYLRDAIRIVIPDESIIDFKEAIVFAFMGVLSDRQEINCLKSVTGASVDNTGGVAYYPHGT